MKTIQYAAVALMVMGLLTGGVPAYAADDVSEAVKQPQTLSALS